MKKYRYFVHYSFTNGNGFGDGNSIRTLRRPIKNMSALLEISNDIKQELNEVSTEKIDSLLITNFILL